MTTSLYGLSEAGGQELLTDDLGINSDGMSCNGGLKYQPAIIVLQYL
jgi:hypothetical protein